MRARRARQQPLGVSRVQTGSLANRSERPPARALTRAGNTGTYYREDTGARRGREKRGVKVAIDSRQAV